MEEEKDKFEDLEKMEDSDWSEFFEEDEKWYEPNIFEDEVVIKNVICKKGNKIFVNTFSNY